MDSKLLVEHVFTQDKRNAHRKIITGFVEWCEREGVDLKRNFGEGDDYYRADENLDGLIGKYQEFLERLVIELEKESR